MGSLAHTPALGFAMRQSAYAPPFFVHDSSWQDKIKTEYMNLYILNSIQNGSNSFGYPQDTRD
jgi:hypothetical protein